VETQNIEYKKKSGERALREICGMANSQGGVVYIGISDDGEVAGVDIDNEMLREIAEKISKNLGIHPEIEVEEREGKNIIAIKVKKSNIPISYKGIYYERVGNTTRKMSPERLKDFLLKGVNWDSLICENATFSDIDSDTVRYFIARAKKAGRLMYFDEDSKIEDVFEHLKLSINRQLTNGAILLFGKDPQKFFINSVLRVVRLKNSITIVGDRLIDGNLFYQAVHGEEAIKQFINVRYEIKELQREEIWDYPLEAMRETLINALIHRDYFKSNVQTQIKIFDDYIWFYNPGGLPEGITIEQLYGPHPSVPRNPLLVHVFYLAGFIEEVGSGIQRIINAMKRFNLPEPRFKEEMGGFSVYLRKDIYTEEYLKGLGLNERQIKAVLYVKEEGKITNREYRNLFGISDRTSLSDLNKLCDIGVLMRKGTTGRSTEYILAPYPKPEKPETNPK